MPFSQAGERRPEKIDQNQNCVIKKAVSWRAGMASCCCQVVSPELGEDGPAWLWQSAGREWELSRGCTLVYSVFALS